MDTNSNRQWEDRWPNVQGRECLRDEAVNRLVPREVDFEKFVLEVSPWERIYNNVFGVNTNTLRRILLGTMTARKFSQGQKQWYCHRWAEGLFDTVTESWFVMVDVIIPTLKQQQLFSEKYPTFLRVESSDGGEYDGGRHDMTFLELKEYRFGLWENIVAMREKLNGSKFVKISPKNPNGKFVLRGFVDIEVPYNCPIVLCEYTEQGMMTLFPFLVPDHKLHGLSFNCHPFETLRQERLEQYKEGVILLIRNGKGFKEIRLKRQPTSEIDAEIAVAQGVFYGKEKGIWEVVWDSEKKKYRGIRPRPEKYVSPVGCRDLPWMGLLIIPEVDFEVQCQVQGRYAGHHVRGSKLILDSGYRQGSAGGYSTSRIQHASEGLDVGAHWSYNITQREGIWKYDTEVTTLMAPKKVNATFLPRVTTGAKLFPLTGEGLMLIQDGEKPWDAVGGKIQPGESLLECVIRETKEETGYVLNPEKIVYLGVSSAYEKPKHGQYSEFHTGIFLIDSVDCVGMFGSRPEGREHAPPWQELRKQAALPLLSVEWLKRLVDYVYKTAGQDPLSWLRARVSSSPKVEAKTSFDNVQSIIQASQPSIMCRFYYYDRLYSLPVARFSSMFAIVSELRRIENLPEGLQVRNASGEVIGQDYMLTDTAYFYIFEG